MNSFNCNEGRHMTVTYKDIRERFTQLEKAKEDRRILVTTESMKLADAYYTSLGLENPVWVDVQGTNKPYVIIGSMHGDRFVAESFSTIPLDEDYGINFTLATVVDDSPRGGESKLVNIYLRIKDGVTTVWVSDAVREISVIDDNWADVCRLIKDKVYMAISDQGLGQPEYF